jgi:putative selenium metabolism protein SsnA
MLIKNAKIITFDDDDRIIENGGLSISADGKILKVLDADQLIEFRDDPEVIDARGKYIMPGGICAHTHFYGAFSRGMYIPGQAPDAFPQILEKLWWRLDKALDKEAVFYSALVCLVDAIKHGTTTLFDHHASPNYISRSLNGIAEAVKQSGVRASLCYEVTDRDGIEKADQGIQENVRFIEKISSANDKEYLNATFGLHASLTLSDQTLKKASESCPDGFGFHIHIAEHQIDEYDSLEKSGLRIVERLNGYGMLGAKSILVHGVHIDIKEAQMIADSGTWLTHQPRSNMNNAVGLPRVDELMNAGVKMCLGNDGFSNSMWAEWKAAYFSHKLLNRDPRSMPADKIKIMAIDNNRKMAERHFNGLKVGRIEEGFSADIIFVDYQPFTDLNKDNLPWHIIFGFQDGMVTDTMVQGEFLMRDREILKIDVKHVMEEAKKISQSVWKRYHSYF